jgi:hypothetical protein
MFLFTLQSWNWNLMFEIMKCKIEIEVCFDVMEAWNWNLSCESKINIKHESNYHWNKKFGLKLNELHSFIQNPLSIACEGFIIIQVLEWVCMLMDPNWAQMHAMFRWFQCGIGFHSQLKGITNVPLNSINHVFNL